MDMSIRFASISFPKTPAKGRFHVEIADTFKKQALGLMHRPKLAKDGGMLFVFETNDIHSFWMKNTLVSLDLIFLDENFTVVDTVRNAPKNSEKAITPLAKSLYVLELTSGVIDDYSIEIGDKVLVSFL